MARQLVVLQETGIGQILEDCTLLHREKSFFIHVIELETEPLSL